MARTRTNTTTTQNTTDTDQTNQIDPVDALPGATVSAIVPAVLSEALEHHRWSQRMSRADVVKQALTEWAEKRDLIDGARERLAAQVAAETSENGNG